jgi:hypothetical protein
MLICTLATPNDEKRKRNSGKQENVNSKKSVKQPSLEILVHIYSSSFCC